MLRKTRRRRQPIPPRKASSAHLCPLAWPACIPRCSLMPSAPSVADQGRVPLGPRSLGHRTVTATSLSLRSRNDSPGVSLPLSLFCFCSARVHPVRDGRHPGAGRVCVHARWPDHPVAKGAPPLRFNVLCCAEQKRGAVEGGGPWAFARARRRGVYDACPTAWVSQGPIMYACVGNAERSWFGGSAVQKARHGFSVMRIALWITYRKERQGSCWGATIAKHAMDECCTTRKAALILGY
jgi:hypothetical protein